jgi:hypothetical protein
MVEFLDGFTLLGAASLSGGTAILTTTSAWLGIRSLTAVYCGSPGYFGSISPVRQQRVLPGGALGVPGESPAAAGLDVLGPNPTRGRVEFNLVSEAPARLELVDIDGRVVSVTSVGDLGPGLHTVDLSHRARIRPGIYFVRLTQGAGVRTRRLAVLQ